MVLPECQIMFETADKQYRAGNYELAQEPLLMLVIDSTKTPCQSDAWFYLGLVRLTMDDPQTAIECFAKIENLEAFGEDLYWYQSLAFVRLAVSDPSRRDLARRAVERALANSSKPERKQKAAEMLKDLSD
jgi:tetratricopeptide (TPR) repeat protein